MDIIRTSLGLVASACLLTGTAHAKAPAAAPITGKKVMEQLSKKTGQTWTVLKSQGHESIGGQLDAIQIVAGAFVNRSGTLKTRTRNGVTRITDKAGLAITLADRGGDPEIRLATKQLGGREDQRQRIRAASQPGNVSASSTVVVTRDDPKAQTRSVDLELVESIGGRGTLLHTTAFAYKNAPPTVRKDVVIEGGRVDRGNPVRLTTSPLLMR